MPLVAGDRWLLSLPLYHVSGMGIVMRAVLSGTCVVIDAVRGLNDAVRDHGISHVSVVHTQLDRLVTACEAGRPLPGLKAVLAGGSSIPGDLVSRALAVGLPLHLSYGSTEMGSQVSTSLSADIAEGISHSGAVLRYREVKISAAGEILVRGEALCQGYLDGGRIRPCTDAEGWFQTGDRGTFTAEGKLCVTGRCDSMFISGGENIYPEEIEAALLALPGVVAAGVVDVPDDTYGARPVAVIKLQGGAALDEAAIRDMLRERLPGFKVPARVLPWPDDYPTGGLKLDRAHLRRYVAAAGG